MKRLPLILALLAVCSLLGVTCSKSEKKSALSKSSDEEKDKTVAGPPETATADKESDLNKSNDEEKDETVASPPETAAADTAEQSRTKWAVAVESKPLSEQVQRGLQWLVAMQRDNGGWGQGEESAQMGSTTDTIKDIPNVGDTCMATLALLRSGSTPAAGAYAGNILRAVNFICGEIGKSDEKSLFVTGLQGTRIQQKLGKYMDTFLALLVLSQVKDHMPDDASRNRIAAAQAKVMAKMERNQKEDGTWDDDGWAPVLAQGFASRALNHAAQSGDIVDSLVLEKVYENARSQYDQKSGTFGGAGSAGIDLYSTGSNAGQMQDRDNTNRQMREALVQRETETADENERAQIKEKISQIDAERNQIATVRTRLGQKLDDEQFVRGFGTNGGEEFLSYMNISETLVVNGGDEWKKWDAAMAQNLNRIQNADGTWTGHHCISGRTFCTSAALLVLMADRAQVPIATKVKQR